MEYRVEIKQSAIKELHKLQADIGKRVLDSLELLATDPRPAQSLKLVETNSSYRLRVGDYRVLYQVDDKAKMVMVLRIAHRKEVYRKS